MEKIENVLPLLKIIFVGDTQVGKTQLINRWCNNKFSNFVIPTDSIDFCSIKLPDACMLVWDNPSSGKQASWVGSYILGSHIICIVVSATDTKRKKLDQINSWLNIVNEKIKSQPAVIILENKMDLNDTHPLTPTDLEQIEGKYTLYKAVSAKQEINITELLQDVLKPLIQAERFKKINNDIKVLSVSNDRKQLNPIKRVDYDLTKQRINSLTENQASIILHSLLNILIYGPFNNMDKAYDIKFFRGKSITFDNNSQITVPEHVFNWISKIKSNPSLCRQSKSILAELYDEIDQASAIKSISRSSSTHDFYNCSLMKFIEHAVTRDILDTNLDYISIKGTIDALSDEKISTILNELITTLEKGIFSGDNDKPYHVGFWGGRTVTTSSTHQRIKVPAHIGALLEYLSTTQDNSKQKLMRALDSVLIAAYSTNANRDISTQNLYQCLPRDLMSRIHQMHIQAEPEIRMPRKDT